MPNIWWMPIQTRTEMLATGIRSVLGIKVFGADLGEIGRVSKEIEQARAVVPGTRSVFAERTTGGYYLNFDVNRDAIARYGLTVGDVQDIVESAIGGTNVSQQMDMEKMISSAKTAADHEALAAEYESEAAAARAKAAEHRKMAESYKTLGGAAIGKLHLDEHCERLVKSYEKAATESEAMASHREMAKAAK